MKIVHFSEFQKVEDLAILDGARWLLINHQDLDDAAAVIFHSELLEFCQNITIQANTDRPAGPHWGNTDRWRV